MHRKLCPSAKTVEQRVDGEPGLLHASGKLYDQAVLGEAGLAVRRSLSSHEGRVTDHGAAVPT